MLQDMKSYDMNNGSGIGSSKLNCIILRAGSVKTNLFNAVSELIINIGRSANNHAHDCSDKGYNDHERVNLSSGFEIFNPG